MRPRPFEYCAPSTLGEALNLLGSAKEAKVLAGGQSLVTLMKLRLISANTLIDLNGIAELTQIREGKDSIEVGALVRHDQLAQSPLIREKLPLLAHAANLVADQQVRNRGTIGGSLAHADPAADLPTACVALNASIGVENVQGSRSINSDDFFKDYFATSLNQNEVIRDVLLPIPPAASGGAYQKFTKVHNDFAVVAVATQLTLGEVNVCKDIRIVLGGVGSIPLRARAAEGSILDKGISEETIEEAAQNACNGLSPPSDIRATAEQRLKMVAILTRRALRTAISRAAEEMA